MNMKTNLVFLLFLLIRCLQARKPYSNIVKDVQVLDLNAQFDIFLCNFDFHIKLHCFAPKMIFLQQKGYKKANMKFSTFWPPKKMNIRNWFIRMEKIQSK